MLGCDWRNSAAFAAEWLASAFVWLELAASGATTAVCTTDAGRVFAATWIAALALVELF
jgi:hypothetical protein